MDMSERRKRFGDESLESISKKIKQNVPANTEKSKKSIWAQFTGFCTEKKYVLDATTSDETLADILKDWAFNMKRNNGEDYKEAVVKTMWNQTAKLLKDKYFAEFKREVDPFSSPVFQEARNAKNAKRRLLQADPQKRMQSATALEKTDIDEMVKIHDEDTPDGLQKKLFLIISVELAWRGGEGASAMVYHFKEETGNDGKPTGRIEYNPIFTKTTQGGDKKCASSKWLIINEENPANCPVRLFEKLISKRGDNVKTDRLFLAVHPKWQCGADGWYKNSAIGKNLIGKWTNESAKKAGLDTTHKKITNHSNRATAVSTLAKAGVGEQQITKITGHSNVNSIKPYLQLDQGHHEQLMKRMRQNDPPTIQNITSTSTIFDLIPQNSTNCDPIPQKSTDCDPIPQSSTNCDPIPQNTTYTYNNCIFHCTNLHMNQ